MRNKWIPIYIIPWLAAACSSSSVGEPVKEVIPQEKQDPMRFTGAEQTAQTRASSALTTGFCVSCFKAFDTAGQQTVMSTYQVNYVEDAWSNVHSWNYVGVNGQSQKYWDYANFPYRFQALAPCPSSLTGFELTDRQLTIPAAYLSQTCVNGMVTPATGVEPYLLAQVQRNTDGTDMDILEGKAINQGSTTKDRDVALPFHHLNCKVRFGIYTTETWPTEHSLYIDHLTIQASNAGGFVTRADGYKASGTGSWKMHGQGFTGLTTSSDAVTLLTFDGGPNVPGNDLSKCQGRSSAYMLQCPDGLVQVPQNGVNMTVSFDLMKGDEVYATYRDVPIKLENSTDLNFDWLSGNIYTYYLVLVDFVDHLELSFTAVLTPWEDLSGSMDTDLEK